MIVLLPVLPPDAVAVGGLQAEPPLREGVGVMPPPGGRLLDPEFPGHAFTSLTLWVQLSRPQSRRVVMSRTHSPPERKAVSRNPAIAYFPRVPSSLRTAPAGFSQGTSHF